MVAPNMKSCRIYHVFVIAFMAYYANEQRALASLLCAIKQHTTEHHFNLTTTLSKNSGSDANDYYLNTTQMTSWAPILPTKELLNSGQSFFIYKFPSGGWWGLGSNLMNLFGKIVYLGEIYNRTPIAVEADYGYRRNYTHGILTGYFTPRFPVLDLHEQYAIVSPYIGDLSLMKFHTRRHRRPVVNQRNITVWLTGAYEYHPDIRRLYKGSDVFYEKMVRYSCPHLQFNDQTKHDIAQIRKDHGLDIDFGSPNITSVAFHVRRTDKKKETNSTKGVEYVAKMVQVIQEVSSSTVDHCFVATDDVVAVEEIKSALKEVHVSCIVHALQSSKQVINKRSDSASTLMFMTELSILQEATYFVGTFSSNVGCLAALLRGCQRSNRLHFAHSYDVMDRQFGLY